MSILLVEPLVPLLAYTMVRVVVDVTEIIRYVESGLTGHLNDAQIFGFYMRRSCVLPKQCVFVVFWGVGAIKFTLIVIAL